MALSSNAADTAADAGNQLAPEGDSGPDIEALKAAFSETIRDCGLYVAQCRRNARTRFALWDGQSADGRKHTRGPGTPRVVPWDGASDMQIFEVDDAINYKIAQNCMALRRANFVAVPVEGNDIARANVVSAFLKWLIRTQIPNLDREEELLENFKQEKGVGITGQFWEVCQQKTLVTLNLDQFQEMYPNVDVVGLLSDPLLSGQFEAMLTEHFDISESKARKVITKLLVDGEAEIPTLGREYSRPVIRAFNLDEDIFIPPWTTDLESAPWIFRVQYHTAAQLRSFVNTDGWDKEWVEQAILTLKGKWISMTPDRVVEPAQRLEGFTRENLTELIGCVYAYQTMSDEDGVPGKFETIFNPNMPKDHLQRGYAKFGLFPYAHGEYPFVLHRREYLSRRVHDTRGIPETGKPAQDQIKAHTDSQIDAASMAVLPPLLHPLSRPPGAWGPGAWVAERRPNEYHYADRPAFDLTTDKSLERLTARFRQQNGIATRDGDPLENTTKNQFEADKTLRCWAQAYKQCWKLWQQYGPEETFFRVVGVKKTDPLLMRKGSPNEDFDIILSFDVQSRDPEIMEKKLKAMAQVLQTFDKFGQADYSQALQIAMEAVDVNWAERIVQPQDMSIQKVVKEEQDALSKIFSGFEEDFDPRTPPQIALKVMEQWMQQPDVAMRYRSDGPFKDRVDKRMKQANFQITQAENAKIGRLGA